MCADFDIHDKKDGNPHAHIMLTMRPLEKNGQWGAKSKLERICKCKPSKLIIGKDGLKDDTAMSNVLYICQDRNIELNLV